MSADDDDAAAEWDAAADTPIDLTPEDYDEIAAERQSTEPRRPAAEPPDTAPHATLAYLAGYEAGEADGERRGAARVLAEVRRRLVRGGMPADEAARIAAGLAKLAGFETH